MLYYLWSEFNDITYFGFVYFSLLDNCLGTIVPKNLTLVHFKAMETKAEVSAFYQPYQKTFGATMVLIAACAIQTHK